MGKHYEEPFRQLVHDLEAADLKAFIAPDGVDPRYQRHIFDTLQELGVTVTETATEANFVIGGYVVREQDGAIGLAIETERVGSVSLFPDGAAIPALA